MKVAFLGLGKLGMPIAVSLARVFPVTGFDLNPEVMTRATYPHKEFDECKEGNFQDRLFTSEIQFAPTLARAIDGADVIFLAIQTPHEQQYEGITPLPKSRSDFDYTHLISCVASIADIVESNQVVAIISTVLPGTIRREIMPRLAGRCKVVYNPLFIAMGTVMHDFFNPEFVLLGGDHKQDLITMEQLYRHFFEALSIKCPPIKPMSVESAELAKCYYNCHISTKIVMANALMELCHKTGADVDDITETLQLATQRIVSPKYMQGGMGDSGGCHPRDNIAMSYLAKKIDLSYDIFESTMMARERQAQWLVDLMIQYGLPMAIYGVAFKPETNIITGSAALLCAELLKISGKKVLLYDPHVSDAEAPLKPHVILIGTKHECFRSLRFPDDSIILDPHRYIPKQKNCVVVPIGKARLLT